MRAGAARALPDLQRGLREQRRRRAAARRAVGGGDPARRGWSQRLLPDDARGRRPARADAARSTPAGRPGPTRDGELVPLRRAGPNAVGSRARSPKGTALLDARDGQGPRRRVPAPGGDRGPPRPGRATADDTDWPQILALYGLLERMTGNPVVTLNRAVAAAMADGPPAASRSSTTVDERLAGHYRLRRGARPPARDGRRHRRRDRALPRRGRPDDEPRRAALPGGAGRAPHQGATLTPPHSSGSTSRTVWVSSHRWPAGSSRTHERSPYSYVVGSSRTRRRLHGPARTPRRRPPRAP